MTALTHNLRKAAVVIRSLDAESAAALLARLSPAEAQQVRQAIQTLGAVDTDEQADVSAEFRRSGAVAREAPGHGVELQLSAPLNTPPPADAAGKARPFEFLEQARIESLVPYLSREHAQTVAVVLSYLPPARAAQLLAALPERIQAAAVERLTLLGDTDPSSLQVLERELADWVARQQATRTRPTGALDTVAAILAAANQPARQGILANLVKHNHQLAEQLTPKQPEPVKEPKRENPQPTPPAALFQSAISNQQSTMRPLPSVHFDDIERFDQTTLAAVLQAVDAKVLVLALVGASDELVDRITARNAGSSRQSIS